MGGGRGHLAHGTPWSNVPHVSFAIKDKRESAVCYTVLRRRVTTHPWVDFPEWSIPPLLESFGCQPKRSGLQTSRRELFQRRYRSEFRHPLRLTSNRAWKTAPGGVIHTVLHGTTRLSPTRGERAACDGSCYRHALACCTAPLDHKSHHPFINPF